MNTKKPKVMASKVIISGNVVEVYEFEDGCLYDFECPKNRTCSDVIPEEWQGKRDDNLRRSRQMLRRIIWSNIGVNSKFLTLTYAENMQDYKVFIEDWRRFVQNLRRKGIKLQYVYVLEYQERGAIHAHVVIFNDEMLPLEAITNAWGRGFVKLNRIKDVKNLGAYVCKYLTKETLAEYGAHSYHASVGLIRPQEIKIDLDSRDTVEAYKSNIACSYSNTYSIPTFDADGNKIGEKTVKYMQGKWK